VTQLPVKPNSKHPVVLYMDRWRRKLEQAMEVQRAEEDEDLEAFEEFFFDELVTFTQEGDSPSTPCRRIFGSLLEYSTPSLCTFV
jgi:hypothetical protein